MILAFETTKTINLILTHDGGSTTPQKNPSIQIGGQEGNVWMIVYFGWDSNKSNLPSDLFYPSIEPTSSRVRKFKGLDQQTVQWAMQEEVKGRGQNIKPRVE